MRKLALAAALLLACGHAPAKPASSPAASAAPSAPAAPPPDPRIAAAHISDVSHQMMRTEGDLLWKRWTTGTGPLPSGALAEHPELAEPDAVRTVAAAAAQSKDDDARALRLLQVELAALAVERETAKESEALDRARAQLAYAAPGDARPEHGERDLDRLLTEEPDAKKRFATALAEAQAAKPLAPLALARDVASERAIKNLDAGSWAELEERLHGITIFDLATLAERTLALTEQVASAAVADTATRNLGISADRLRRADLARLVRSSAADAEFPAGDALKHLDATLGVLGLTMPSSLRIDAEPSPSKGARPLALLVDPPGDVRFSVRPSGGFEEQRAVLHEGARAVGGTEIRQPRWELAQLGDGAGADAVAELFQSLAGEPEWLRDRTKLRGEPLDDIVHTQAAYRLLAARRAAAMVLFEIRRREGLQNADAQATLYRGLLQRATFAVMSDDDANRWAVEADTWVHAAPQLVSIVLAAQLEEKLGAAADAQPWWRNGGSAQTLHQIWAGGRSLSGPSAAKLAGLDALDPSALARVAQKRLEYRAPERPPPAQKPDYKYMQGDKKKRRHRKHK